MSGSTWAGESLAVLRKELTSELRSRVALNAVGLFALTTLIAVAYQIGPYRIQEQDRPHLLAALLWIILFFAALAGLPRVFVKEEDSHTAKTLRLAARPGSVFAGKFAFNLLLLIALEVSVVPLYCALMGYVVHGVVGLVAVMLCGAVALAASTTLVAAIISRASGSGTLFAVLTVPLALPLLVILIQGTRAAAADAAFAAVAPALQGIVSLAGVSLVAATFLFPVVWND